ncbi:Retrovirus-related Pol polyprotein from transposon 297 [Araneus ventricosus]|uniref:Retrovirus-related Pol polyprotein from transposon 297 n=1 Tax=Araneus ventricosus TaxID=182803 RepID=A0A4Y2N195_ARAVE|nr:Retrovirus-related Pol polyprotein from transposon 297 [Araneus ventricosus]
MKTQYFPLLNIEERVERVAAANYISVLDLTKGYWQLPLTKRAQRYAGFATNFGCYIPKTLPFGLVSAPFTFSKFMAELLKGCEDFCVLYLDDIAIFSSSLDEKVKKMYVKHLDAILGKIGNAKLKIKPSKCSLGRKTVKYLGHVVGNGIRNPVEAKIQAIVNFSAPINKTEIRRLIGIIGYYSRYIKDYAKIVEPLTNALKEKNKREQITWTPECQKAFDTIKGKLVERPVLHAPDYSKPFIIQVDSSNTGTGVVLCQREKSTLSCTLVENS